LHVSEDENEVVVHKNNELSVNILDVRKVVGVCASILLIISVYNAHNCIALVAPPSSGNTNFYSSWTALKLPVGIIALVRQKEQSALLLMSQCSHFPVL
jgi:hypothetical protein